MKLSRSARLSGMALAGALALAACGSDNNSSSSSTSGGSAGASGSSSSAPALSGTLNGEGSTAQKNAIDEAVATFTQNNPNAKVSYNATGSGAGIKSFNGGQVDWAGSDSALKTDPGDGGAASETDAAKKRCGGNDAWNLPLVAGPIAVAYNLQGVDKLVLNPVGDRQDLPGQDHDVERPGDRGAEPRASRCPARRSASSTAPTSRGPPRTSRSTWPARPRATSRPSRRRSGPAPCGQGAAKSAGVAQGIQSTPGGIGYIEWSNAKDSKLGVAQVDNGGGAVELTADSAGKAVEAAHVTGTGNDLRLKLDYATKTAGVYPIVLVTYEIVCSKGLAADKTALLKGFLTYIAQADTQKSLADIGYATLPDSVLSKVNTAINAIS